jgi:hypothetical protein
MQKLRLCRLQPTPDGLEHSLPKHESRPPPTLHVKWDRGLTMGTLVFHYYQGGYCCHYWYYFSTRRQPIVLA